MLNMLDEVLYQPLGITFCFSDINVLDEDGCVSRAENVFSKII